MTAFSEKCWVGKGCGQWVTARSLPAGKHQGHTWWAQSRGEGAPLHQPQQIWMVEPQTEDDEGAVQSNGWWEQRAPWLLAHRGRFPTGQQELSFSLRQAIRTLLAVRQKTYSTGYT